MIGAIRPALNKHGIAVIQVSESDLERQTASVTTSLHFGDQWISATAEAPAVGKSKDGKDRFDIQTMGAAWTYLRRYTLQALVAVPSEDDDGNMVARDDARSVPAKRLDPPASITPQMEKTYTQWRECFDEADTVEKFNLQVVPLMKERGKDFVKAAAQIAKDRHYKPNRETGLYEQSTEVEHANTL